MRVLITGATGLIGTHLSQTLRQHKIDVHYLSIDKKIKSEPSYTGFYWNPQQGIIDESCMLGVDVIVHLAGAPISKRWTASYKQEIIESRTLPANLLYKTLKNNPHQVKRIISASAIGIYPDSLTENYIESDTRVDESFLGEVVVKWEQHVDKFKRLNIEVSKLRTGLVLSAAGGVLQELTKIIKLNMGSPLGSGKQWQSWIHIDDIVGIYLHLITQQTVGVYNGVAPNPVTNKSLTHKIAAVLSKSFFMPNVPEPMLKLALGEMHYLLIASQKVSAEKIQSAGYNFKFLELDEALVDLLK